jgi:hypothetical protein
MDIDAKKLSELEYRAKRSQNISTVPIERETTGNLRRNPPIIY